MKNIINKKFAYLLAILSGLCIAINAYTPEYTKYVTERYVNSFPIDIEIVKKEESPLTRLQKIKKHLRFDPLELQEITNNKKRSLALNLLPIEHLSEKNIIDKTFIDKLEIVSAETEGDRTENLTTKISNNIQTSVGRNNCLKYITQPLIDTPALEKRQQIIKNLTANKAALETLSSNLSSIALSEAKLLSSLQPFGEIKDLINNVLYDTWPWNYFEKSPELLELKTRYSHLNSLDGLFPIPMIGIGNYILKGEIFLLNKMNFTDIAQKVETGKTWFDRLNIVFWPLRVYGIILDQNNKSRATNYLQKTLIDISSFIKNTRKITELLSQDAQIIQNLENFENLKNLFNGSEKYSANMHKLVKVLETSTFEGELTILSFSGRVLAAHKLMELVKSEFNKVIAAIAEIDMYVGIAKLVSDHENKPSKYCFAKFINNSSKPVIKAIEFWNPLINSKFAVPNSIEIATEKEQTQNVILTGPNTGGKSVLIKGLILNLLLAQTFGIATAQELEFTPFSNLNAYLNVTDNINANTSLFKAEVLRAKELITNIRRLPANEFSFTIMDEVFSGTSPQEGEFAAYAFSKQLGKCKNSISIIATHYPKMVNLEKEPKFSFKNYLVEVTREPDGTIKRTFKLKPGINHINIAMDILREEGIVQENDID